MANTINKTAAEKSPFSTVKEYREYTLDAEYIEKSHLEMTMGSYTAIADALDADPIDGSLQRVRYILHNVSFDKDTVINMILSINSCYAGIYTESIKFYAPCAA